MDHTVAEYEQDGPDTSMEDANQDDMTPLNSELEEKRLDLLTSLPPD